MNKNQYKVAWFETWKSFGQMLFILSGVLLIISLLNNFLSPENYNTFFTGNFLFDSIKGGMIGSIIGGNPANSYIIGGSLLNEGVGIAAVVAFMITWVTVGFINIPLESEFFGLKFAVWRNIINIFLAILMGILMSFIF